MFRLVASHPKSSPRSSAWVWIPVRVLIVTLLLTLISFAITLLLSLLVLIMTAQAGGIAPNLTIAYGHIALPTAIVIGTATLIVSTTMEVRHHRQTKALARIAKISSGT